MLAIIGTKFLGSIFFLGKKYSSKFDEYLNWFTPHMKNVKYAPDNNKKWF